MSVMEWEGATSVLLVATMVVMLTAIMQARAARAPASLEEGQGEPRPSSACICTEKGQ